MKKVLLSIVLLFILASPGKILALRPGTGGGNGNGGGGSSNLGQWANYGTFVQYVSCMTTTLIIVDGAPVVEIVYVQKPVYFLHFQCDLGGTSCTLGTAQTIWQGGGC